MSLDYYCGPWIWNAAMHCWAGPTGTVSAIDFRPLSQQAVAGGTPGIGVFCTDRPLADSNYDHLGNGLWYDIKPTKKQIAALPARKGYNPKGDDLVGLLLDLLTNGADPAGQDAPKPILPTARRRVELHLGQSHVESFLWGTAHAAMVQTLLRSEFAGLMQDAQAGKLKDSKQPFRVLDFWCEKFGVDDWTQFVPAALVSHVPGRVPHNTTITDNFNRADSGTLGSSSEGWSWTSNMLGNFGITSNQAKPTAIDAGTTIALARADSDLSSADHYGQANVVTNTFHTQVAARVHSSANTCYNCGIFTGDSNIYLQKLVAGTGTNLGNAASGGPSTPYAIKCSANGSTIKAYLAGVEKVSVTDTAVTGNLRGGLRCADLSDILDDFQAADLAASSVLYTQLESNPRGLNRGMWTGRS